MKKTCVILIFAAFISKSQAPDWTWLSGSNVPVSGYNVYPTGPGARTFAAQWKDSQGNLWLFGGSDLSSSSIRNDLWKYTPSTNKWIWMKGSSASAQLGVYGTQGTPASGNTPGARLSAVSWTDSNGKLWLFGGDGFASGNAGMLNDLWKYDPATNQWTWVSGDNNTSTSSGVYGTQGTPNISNKPGHRQRSCGWIDSNNDLWLYGGWGYAINGLGLLEDLWKFDVALGQWVWMKGSGQTNLAPVHGTVSVQHVNNSPGGREIASSWLDASGNLILFGGNLWTTGINDLWKFDVSTNNWVWLKGSNTGNQQSSFGTMGTAASTNCPGARSGSATWKDSNNQLWLFGGFGTTSVSSYHWLNDLWKYNPSTNEWTWMKGTTQGNQNGRYNAMGVQNSQNNPGGRDATCSWFDGNGNLWFFGGRGYAASGGIGPNNDLWKYNISSGIWSWVNGSNMTAQAGFFGTQGATPTPCYPGIRENAVMWTRPNGELWIFGGSGPVNSNGSVVLNDLWKYDPSISEWTWIRGSLSGNANAVIGTPGTPNVDNTPSGSTGSAGWVDAQGNLWMYGNANTTSVFESAVWKYNTLTNEWTCMNHGNFPVYGTKGVPSAANTPGLRANAVTVPDAAGMIWLFSGDLRNDLWKYNPGTNEWTWVSGGSTQGNNGVYGTKGVPSTANVPGARYSAYGWCDLNNRIWIFGGLGVDKNPQSSPNVVGGLNDLWRFDPAGNTWTWISGADSYALATAVYGTKGNSSSSNTPGPRVVGATWTDRNTGELYLLGGTDKGQQYNGQFLNDFWKFSLVNSQWTWLKGSNLPDQNGVYGTIGVPSSGNNPGARSFPTWCRDTLGRCLLFGGRGLAGTGTYTLLHDLWMLGNCFGPASPLNVSTSQNMTFCDGGIATLSVTSAFPVQWFGSASSGTMLASGTSFTTASLSAGNYSFYVEAAGTCTVNSLRTPLIVTVHALPAVSISPSSQTLCNGAPYNLSAGGALTYTWSDGSNGQSLSGILTSNATFSVTGKDANGCENTAFAILFTANCTGIPAGNTSVQVDIYPNPTNGHIRVDTGSPLKIRLTDSQGRILLSGESSATHDLDLSALANGIYFLSAGNSQPVKIVLQK